jgi:SAM-dependent methyltransferase
MQFNSPTGKAILSLVRQGDYAHPGEEAAIDLLFADIPKNLDRRVLDLGCGRGGTAAYVQRHGWGRVTGVDIDGETLGYAQERYRGVQFLAADVATIANDWRNEFELLYLFNSFYAFPDQRQALTQMFQVARPGATLAIFDYTDRLGRFREFASQDNAFWQPINPTSFAAELQRAGWELMRLDDLTTLYVRWYQDLCARIKKHRREIERDFGSNWYDFALATYSELLGLLEKGVLGGAIVWARCS